MNARARISTLALAIAAGSLAAGPATAVAQVRPAQQRVLSRGVPDAKTPAARTALARVDRTFYGRIAAMRGNLLTVRLRDGRLATIDATEAIRDGTYSAPLFVGKGIGATGYVDASRIVHARVVERQTLDAGVPADH